MEQYFSTVLPFLLKKLLTEHKNILIHCYAGKQRSAILCAALLFVLVDNDIMTFKSKNNESSSFIGGSSQSHNIININDKSKLMKKIIQYMLEKRPCVFTYGFRVNFKKSIERFFNIKI